MEAALIAVAAGRPVAGETVSGDAWQLDRYAETWRVAVIDGLGHGPDAAAAAEAARATLMAHPHLGPADALAECHAALHATRGAAMWVGAVAPGERLIYAGVGNVEAQLWQAGGRIQLVGQRGIVGATLPRVRPNACELQQDWLLLVHTDGIRERFALDATPIDTREDLQRLVDRLLEVWSRPHDDALVVALRAAQS